ncbi:hypothetical protein HYALB_00006803 [Hymenoscyphus albidus]|uniref:SET domain-containing protein n=1 Tax=Hymenoscyphus albidus TaxID=595503 RepID=A0A9N9LN48_9HELO|nr:hypothetical protein HYALB_00006803 [Hymenoscyphus albidus]
MSRHNQLIDLTTPEPEPIPQSKRKRVQEVDLTSPPPGPRPRHEPKPAPKAQFIDLTEDLSNDADETQNSSTNSAAPSRINRPSLSKSTPSVSIGAATFSAKSNLDERSANSPVIKSSPKNSKPTAQREQSVPLPRPRFRIPSPVPERHPSSNFPNLPGLERPAKQGSLATSIQKKPDAERPQQQPVVKGEPSTGINPEGQQSKRADSQTLRKNLAQKLEIAPSKPASPQQTQRTNADPGLEGRESIILGTQSKINNNVPELRSAQSNLGNTSLPPKSVVPEHTHSRSASAQSQLKSTVTAPERAQFKDGSIQSQSRSNVTQPANKASVRHAGYSSKEDDERSGRKATESTSGIFAAAQDKNKLLNSFDGPRPHTDSPSESSRGRTEGQNVITSTSSVMKPSELDDSVDFKALLLSFKEDMEVTHAFNVAYLSEEASKMTSKDASQTHPAKELSPFASMKSIENILANPEESNVLSFKAGVPDNKGKLTLSTSRVVSNQITCDYVPIPKYTSLTFIHRNILCPDDGKPKVRLQEDELGSNGDISDDDLDKSHKAHPYKPYWQAEYKKRLYGNIQFWLEEGKIKCTQEHLEKYLIAQDTGFQNKFVERNGTLYDAKLCIDAYQVARRFTNAFDKVFEAKQLLYAKKGKKGKNGMNLNEPLKLNLQDVLLSKGRQDELLELENSSKPGRTSLDNHQQAPQTPMSAVETYTTLTCLICGVIECQTHGEFTEDEAGYLTKPERITIQPDDLLRKHIERQEKLGSDRNDANQSPCSSDCYLVVGAGTTPFRALTEAEINDISLLLISVGRLTDRCCYIAFGLGLPCSRVFQEIDRQEREKKIIPPQPKLSEAGIRAAKIAWYDNKRKVLDPDWKEMTCTHIQEKRTQAVPCHHAGPCSVDVNCPCFLESLLCEDMCSCSDDCPRRFMGCSCRSNDKSCLDGTCICKEMNRECGPHCSCGALERLNPANRHNDDLFATGCQNVVLQRGVPKATLVGISQLAGQGLYAGEPILKGDYIDEYCSELISQGEADRRGITYDRHGLSFLFDLNKEWALDGHRYANKTRFINHAATFQTGLNCKAEILWVNGEHRIKFYALRDIEAGEELLFNYGKVFAEKHNLNKKLPKMQISKKLAAEGAKESGGASRSTKGGRATRGGHGLSGRAGKYGQNDRDEDVEEEAPEEEDPAELEILNRIAENAGNDDEDYEEDGNICWYPGCRKKYARIDSLRKHQRQMGHGNI